MEVNEAPETRGFHQEILTKRQTSYNWAFLMAQVVGEIQLNVMDLAADILIANTFDFESEFSEVDKEGCQSVFTHPIVLENTIKLWARMEPAIQKGLQQKVRQDLTALSWKLKTAQLT